MCGEMAGNPLATALLVGLGINELSVVPSILPEIKKIIRSIEFEQARNLVEEVMKLNDSKEIERFLDEEYHRKFSNENSART